jgi:thiol:disulfide interchange protein
MKLALFAVALVPFVTSAVVRVEDPAPKPKVEKKEPVYDESAIGSEQLANALAKAKKENRRVLVQWGANWCGWCTLLAQLEKSNAEISRKLLYEYDLVKIDIGTWEKLKHADLIEKYGVDLKTHGVPYLTVLDSDGKVIANQDTGSLELADKTKATIRKKCSSS